MKKILVPALLICMCLFTGCTKKYDSVKDYSKAMQEVRAKLGDYTIQTVLSSREMNLDCITYKKGDLWKTETSKNGGKNYSDGILYDGNEVYSYSKSQNFAMSMPFKQMMPKNEDGEKALNIVMKMINPTGILFYWDMEDIVKDDSTGWTFGKITKKNGFKCRMLNHKAGGQVCVNDKYGIAVYAKINTPKQGEVEYNVKKIENKTLTNTDVSLPAGIKKMSMTDLFKNMAKMAEENEEE